MFKTPGLSVLQIGGFDQGLTDSLLSVVETGRTGATTTSKILLLDPIEENVSRARERYDSESSAFRVLHLDEKKSTPTQTAGNDKFDILLVTIDSHLDGTRKGALLTEARSMLKSGGIFVAFDTLRNVKDK